MGEGRVSTGKQQRIRYNSLMAVITNKNDINFLISHTGLKEERLNLLLEEDSQVILESASTAPFEHCIVNISFPMFVKLSILQIKEARKFPAEEQDYIVHSVAESYPKICKQSHYYIDQKHLGESEAQLYLVLTGLFPEFLISLENRRAAPNIRFYIELAQTGFKSAKKWDIAEHVHDWVAILNRVKQTTWNKQK